MATRLLFSFDAPAGATPPSVLMAMGARPRHQLFSHVWLLECKDDEDAKAFTNLLSAIQVGDPSFVFVALAWVDGSPDVYVTAKEAA